MNLKKALTKIMPASIKTYLRGNIRNDEIQKLNSLDIIHCDTTQLLSKGDINSREIFNSEKIEYSWTEATEEVNAFAIPDFTGGVNPGDRRAIFYLIRYFKPNSVLEIGTHIGASTINIASALYKNQLEDKTKSFLHTLDIKDVNSTSEEPWLQYGTKKSPVEMLKSLNYETFVQFITDSSLHYLGTNNEKFDFIFLDGDHSGEIVFKEIPLALKKLKKGGVILLHDYFPNGKPLWSNGSIIPGPYLATERHIMDGADITVIPLGDLPWLTKLDSKTTSLALLLKKN